MNALKRQTPAMKMQYVWTQMGYLFACVKWDILEMDSTVQVSTLRNKEHTKLMIMLL